MDVDDEHTGLFSKVYFQDILILPPVQKDQNN